MMGIDEGRRTGIDFTKFRTNEVTDVKLANCSLDDDDIVFLEEWYVWVLVCIVVFPLFVRKSRELHPAAMAFGKSSQRSWPNGRAFVSTTKE